MTRGVWVAVRLLPFAAIVALGGCGGVTQVRATVVRPAAVPVRSFPTVWIALGDRPQERGLARLLREHLSSGQRMQVRLVDIEDLEPARLRGRIPRAAVVVILALSFREATRVQWQSRPETVCGLAGCYTAYRNYAMHIPVLHAQLVVTVYDGPTARVNQRSVLRARPEGADHERLRARAGRILARRLRASVDQRSVGVEVEFLSSELPQVDTAVERIADGDWSAGRRSLEQIVKRDAFRSQNRESRARILYNLGQARRFDSAGDATREQLAAAERALRAAHRLDPQDRYREALRSLRDHQQALRLVQRQREAAAHNYAIATQEAAVPQPPPSYRSSD